MHADEDTGRDEANSARLSEEDANHLQLLTIFHYVFGGLVLVGGFCPGVYMIPGFIWLFGGFEKTSGDVPPDELVIAIGSLAVPPLLMVATWALGGLVLYTGRCFQRRQYHVFCQVMAGIECVFFPIGTALGVFSLLVLSRSQVAAAFKSKGQRLPAI